MRARPPAYPPTCAGVRRLSLPRHARATATTYPPPSHPCRCPFSPRLLLSKPNVATPGFGKSSGFEQWKAGDMRQALYVNTCRLCMLRTRMFGKRFSVRTLGIEHLVRDWWETIYLPTHQVGMARWFPGHRHSAYWAKPSSSSRLYHRDLDAEMRDEPERCRYLPWLEVGAEGTERPRFVVVVVTRLTRSTRRFVVARTSSTLRKRARLSAAGTVCGGFGVPAGEGCKCCPVTSDLMSSGNKQAGTVEANTTL